MDTCPSCGSNNFTTTKTNKNTHDETIFKCFSCGWSQCSIYIPPSNSEIDRMSQYGAMRILPIVFLF